MSQPSIIVAYWNVRGLGQSIRNILEHLGIEYVDKLYDFDMTDADDKAKSKSMWTNDKSKCPLVTGSKDEKPMEFPNLPYYVETRPDGSKLKISQSLAIMKHIGRMHGLTVEGEDNVTKMEHYEQQIMDLRTSLVGYCYDDLMVNMRYPSYPEDIKAAIFSQWDRVLDGKTWIMGDKLTYVDFMFWECVDWHVLLKGDMLDGFENLKSYHQRFLDLPKVKAYFNSSRYKSWPLVGPFAMKFGYHR